MKLRPIVVLFAMGAVVGGLAWYFLSAAPVSSDATVAKPVDGGSGASNGAAAAKAAAMPASADKSGQATNAAVAESSGRNGTTTPAASSDKSDRFVYVTDTSATISPSPGSTTGSNAGASTAKGLHLATVPQKYDDFAVAYLPKALPLRRFSPDSIKLEPGIPIYDIDRAAFAQGIYNRLIFKDAYYYGVDSNDVAVFGFGVSPADPTGDTLRIFGGTPTGPDYTKMTASLQYLAGLAQVQAGSYEVRLVMMSGISNAIWLKSPSGDADLFYTLDQIVLPGTQKIAPGTLLSGSDYLSAVGAVQQGQYATRLARGGARSGG